MQPLKKSIYYFLLTGIICLSFFHFSGLYYPYLNSDAAIHILMANKLSFPQDFYFWGQDRLGSIIPLISAYLMKLMGIKAVSAVSFSQYLVLFFGFVFIAKLLNKPETKLLLAVFWFLPPLIFIDFVLIAQPYGVQISLLAIAIFLFDKIQKGIKNNLEKQFYIVLLSTLLILCIWVSDIAVISILLLAIMGLLSFFEVSSNQKYIQIKKMNIFKEIRFYHISFWVLIGILFIIYAKSTAVTDSRYSDQAFNDLSSTISGIWISIKQMFLVLTFRFESNIFLGVFFWMAILVIPSLFFFRKNDNGKTVLNKWFWFFIIQGIVSLFAIYISKWVYLNGMSRRYFVLPWISFAIAFLLYLDKKSLKPIFIYTIILLLGLTSILSSVLPLNYPNKLSSRYEQLKEFKRLGEVGIISEYWNSYISAVASPDQIIATPHDSAYVRNPALAEAVLKQPRIILIKDLWFEEFPEVTVQFGHFLKIHKAPFQIGGANLCEYRLSNLYMIFQPEDLKSEAGKIQNDPHSKYGKALKASISDKEKFIAFGPYTNLPAGNFSIKFILSIDNQNTNNKIAFIDVCSKWGQLKHCSLEISGYDFTEENSYQGFEMKFEAEKPLQNVEFRIYLYGNANLSFSHIELSQL